MYAKLSICPLTLALHFNCLLYWRRLVVEEILFYIYYIGQVSASRWWHWGSENQYRLGQTFDLGIIYGWNRGFGHFTHSALCFGVALTIKETIMSTDQWKQTQLGFLINDNAWFVHTMPFQKLEYDIMHFLNTCNIVQMLI